MGCNTSRPEAVRQWAHNDGVSPTLLGKNTEARRQQQRNPVMEQAVVPNSSSRDLLELKSLHDAYVERGDMNGCMVRMEGGDGRPIEDVYEGVRDGKELGRGAFGVVRLATHRATGVQYAVKCIQHTQLPTKESINLLKKEIQVMCELDHPSIVRIAAAYESDHEIFIVQELCRGGDLFDRLESRLNEADELNETGLHFTESQCAQYVKQMLAATSYLHSKGIVHRDLKLEHFMFSTPGSQELRMIDFGYASHLDDSGRVSGMAGTTYTKAPEVLQGGEYNEKFDLWSIGVLAYLLLAGDTPFGSLDENSSTRSNSCKRAIRHEKLKFEPQEKWDQISNEAKVFIQRLLERDPEERPSAAQALEDPWITACTNSGGCTDKNLSSSTLKSLLAFRRASEVQKLLSEVLSYTLFPAQIMGLRREFAKIDQHDTGVIDLDSMKEVLLRSSRNSGWLLSEKNVEEIFDSIKTTKTEKSIPIRWHEFLAAGITQTQYDERNMRLCFEKLDTRNRNYITFDDLARIVGRDANSEGLAESWRQSIEDLKIEGERITYIDFAKLMKGRDEPLKLAPGNTEPPIGSNIPKGPGLEDPGTTSPPLQAHTGDVFDKFLNEVTSSSLIANRSLHTQSRDLFLPTVVESMLTANIASIKLVRKHRGKANSSPASADCCKARHSRRISDSNF